MKTKQKKKPPFTAKKVKAVKAWMRGVVGTDAARYGNLALLSKQVEACIGALHAGSHPEYFPASTYTCPDAESMGIDLPATFAYNDLLSVFLEAVYNGDAKTLRNIADAVADAHQRIDPKASAVFKRFVFKPARPAALAVINAIHSNGTVPVSASELVNAIAHTGYTISSREAARIKKEQGVRKVKAGRPKARKL